MNRLVCGTNAGKGRREEKRMSNKRATRLKAPIRSAIIALGAFLGFAALCPAGPAAPTASTPKGVESERDGSHDFDFEIGEWSTHLKRLRHPLSGSSEWVEYQGTSRVTGLLGGRANVVELEVKGEAGAIDGVSLRLYEPDAHQWTLNFANITDGHLTTPMVGEFRDRRGQFYGQDAFKGRAILVRFIAAPVNADTWRFEQAFSDDGGRTWETNWIATDTRLF
jgi:hypothetical protein